LPPIEKYRLNKGAKRRIFSMKLSSGSDKKWGILIKKESDSLDLMA